MDFQTLFIIAATTVIHFIGIGLFVFWLAIGKPMSAPEWERWWKRVHFLRGWHEGRVEGDRAGIKQSGGGQRC